MGIVLASPKLKRPQAKEIYSLSDDEKKKTIEDMFKTLDKSITNIEDNQAYLEVMRGKYIG